MSRTKQNLSSLDRMNTAYCCCVVLEYEDSLTRGKKMIQYTWNYDKRLVRQFSFASDARHEILQPDTNVKSCLWLLTDRELSHTCGHLDNSTVYNRMTFSLVASTVTFSHGYNCTEVNKGNSYWLQNCSVYLKWGTTITYFLLCKLSWNIQRSFCRWVNLKLPLTSNRVINSFLCFLNPKSKLLQFWSQFVAPVVED